VENILRGEESRGEQIARLNIRLFDDLRSLAQSGRTGEMEACYQAYLGQRGATYMSAETGHAHDLSKFGDLAKAFEGEGYAGVALDLIEGLTGRAPGQMILNIQNQGAVCEMDATDVVEIPAWVGYNMIHPMAVGEIPAHCLGLMKQVKAYEKLTVEAAVEGSYAKAQTALTLHPIVADRSLATAILDEYLVQHGSYFPKLK
jgi:6-phospho-beta-glucosidase